MKQLASVIKYQNKWMTVREDQVEFDNGQPGIYGVVEKPDFSLIVPYQEGSFYLVRQYRYPVQASFWEFPQGSYEEKPETDSVTVAQKELLEEAGVEAGKWEEIGFLYEAYGYCNQGFHIYLATEIVEKQQQLEVSEQGLEVHKFSVTEFEKLIEDGEIRDAPTVSAYGLLQAKRIL